MHGHFKQTGNYHYRLKKENPSDQNTENMKFTCRINSHTKSSDLTWFFIRLLSFNLVSHGSTQREVIHSKNNDVYIMQFNND